MQTNKLNKFIQDIILGVFCNVLSNFLEVLPMSNFVFFIVFVSITVITPPFTYLHSLNYFKLLFFLSFLKRYQYECFTKKIKSDKISMKLKKDEHYF